MCFRLLMRALKLALKLRNLFLTELRRVPQGVVRGVRSVQLPAEAIHLPIFDFQLLAPHALRVGEAYAENVDPFLCARDAVEQLRRAR